MNSIFLKFAVSFATIFVAISLPVQTQAADWKPEKNIEIVSGAPGSGYDRYSRTMQRIWQMQKIIPTTITVNNKPGGGGTIAWTYVSQHAGDGHYIAPVAVALLTNNLTGSTPLTFHDVTPLAILGTEYAVVAVKGDSPLKRGQDLADKLKQNPGSVVFGISPGLGTHSHIAVALIAKSVGVDARKLRTVVYAGGSEAVTALLGGHVEAVCVTAGNMLAYFAGGQLRPLGIAGPQRSGGALANIPTWKEQGVDAVSSNWRGVIAPKGLNAAQIAYWDDIFAKTVRTDDWKKELDNNSLEPLYLGSGDAVKFLEGENQRLKAILTDLGLVK